MSQLKALKNSVLGQDIFILGNGPSLTLVDLEKLRGRVVIGMNASPLVEERYGLSADYYVVSDARFLNNPDKRELATTRLSDGTKRVLRGDLKDLDDPRFTGGTYYVPVLGKNGYSSDLERGFYFGCTTMMLAIQLADFIGGKRIFLLGADFKYTADQKRFYSEKIPDPVDPFLSIQLWNVWNARQELVSRGRELYLCSPSSNLAPYLPLVDLNKLLSGTSNTTAKERQ